MKFHHRAPRIHGVLVAEEVKPACCDARFDAVVALCIVCLLVCRHVVMGTQAYKRRSNHDDRIQPGRFVPGAYAEKALVVDTRACTLLVDDGALAWRLCHAGVLHHRGREITNRRELAKASSHLCYAYRCHTQSMPSTIPTVKRKSSMRAVGRGGGLKRVKRRSVSMPCRVSPICFVVHTHYWSPLAASATASPLAEPVAHISITRLDPERLDEALSVSHRTAA